VRLTDRKTLKGFYVFNTHLDNDSQEARERSIALLHQRITERTAPVPVVLFGDFNASPENVAIRQAIAPGSPAPVDAYAAAGDKATTGTYHGFTGRPEDHPIDYIFLSREWKIADCRILADSSPPFLSDHFPLSAILES
jgi:endonuclease/exonuclease/phosphatase family metal-dependent hydrolase